jgi:hypothetical protein
MIAKGDCWWDSTIGKGKRREIGGAFDQSTLYACMKIA